MNRSQLLDKIEEITDRNYRTFRGTNEAELHTREELADLMRDELINYAKWYDRCTMPEDAQTLEEDLIQNVDSYLQTKT